jgi:hypothetical protein
MSTAGLESDSTQPPLTQRHSKVLNGSTGLNPPAIMSKVTEMPTWTPGVVFTLDAETGRYYKTLEDATMRPAGSIQFGINGTKIRGRYVYLHYTTTG